MQDGPALKSPRFSLRGAALAAALVALAAAPAAASAEDLGSDPWAVASAGSSHCFSADDGLHGRESVQKRGDHLVFTTQRPGTAQVVDLWLADLDGSGAQKLTANLALTGAGPLTDLGRRC
jgi:hypothetical protein